ncbi:hypothetical protein KIW84_064397 [Lathyrus oleraceus]|uniref:Uncharacterized protein n=1 Tax=Pisum sativum TaxID=3888 RepID=A0A9D5A913_PEA|nr:hypothetical protein KIW84_064397 [Pisum sativum]
MPNISITSGTPLVSGTRPSALAVSMVQIGDMITELPTTQLEVWLRQLRQHTLPLKAFFCHRDDIAKSITLWQLKILESEKKKKTTSSSILELPAASAASNRSQPCYAINACKIKQHFDASSSTQSTSFAWLLPQYKNSIFVSSLPQSAAIPSGCGFGSSTSIPGGNYPLNPTGHS